MIDLSASEVIRHTRAIQIRLLLLLLLLLLPSSLDKFTETPQPRQSTNRQTGLVVTKHSIDCLHALSPLSDSYKRSLILFTRQ